MPHGRLPSRFPVGTKFVIEAKYSGRSHVYRRHLEFPDGRVLRLPDQPPTIVAGKAARSRRRSRRPV